MDPGHTEDNLLPVLSLRNNELILELNPGNVGYNSESIRKVQMGTEQKSVCMWLMLLMNSAHYCFVTSKLNVNKRVLVHHNIRNHHKKFVPHTETRSHMLL